MVARAIINHASISRVVINIDGDRLALSGVLNYESVLDVDQQGQAWLKGPAPAECNLDLDMVTYSTSAGIALLLGWLRIATQQKKSLRIQKLPENMAALAKVCGLDDFFQ